jgi:hypothetical protein
MFRNGMREPALAAGSIAFPKAAFGCEGFRPAPSHGHVNPLTFAAALSMSGGSTVIFLFHLGRRG